LIGGVHHIGYRVSNLAEAIAEYQKLFGSSITRQTILPNGTPIAFVSLGTIQVELMQNTLEQGQHLDHIAYIIEDIDAEVASLKANGAEFATASPSVNPTGAKSIIMNILGSRIQIYQPAK
jgi:predicted enzyme related to lactoylglutathione lyase